MSQPRRPLRNYWVYSTGLAAVWAVLLIVTYVVNSDRFANVLYVFAGFAICWVSATIAREIYPPPSKWTEDRD